ncbi:MAG: hypothetical protein M1824_006487 [Vezdaea acicularis]|nr:MAG: hypothetical protein M1824_006487 [Vezdaea acicularis]
MSGLRSNRGQKRGSETRGSSISPPPSKRKVPGSMTKDAVASFFTPSSKKEPEKTTWQTRHQTLLVATYNQDTKEDSLEKSVQQRKKRKVAAFDLDSTLIATASGKRFSSDVGDWKWWHTSVPETLKSLLSQGYIIVVMSNQGGIKLGDPKFVKQAEKRVNNFKSKVSAILSRLDMPVTLYAATGQDNYRKPCTGMWDEMLKDHDLQSAGSIDLKASFLVGDAAGRLAYGKMPQDHSCSDRNFAANVGIGFHTPEEYFAKESPRPFTRDFNPDDYIVQAINILDPPTFSKELRQEIALFCGSPGAGKSTFYWNYLKPLGYQRVNQDILKSRNKCVQAAKVFLKDGKSVVVDNTNAEPDTRAMWIQLAQAHAIPIRCFYFTADPNLCRHNNAVRALSGDLMNPEDRTILPQVAFTSFRARLRPPTKEEGFQEIFKIDFKFEGNDEQRLAWSRFWI